MRFRISATAQRDIAEISEHIAADNAVRALSFARELRARIGQLTETPLSYRERPELAPGVRAARHGRYLIFFRIGKDCVEILHVRHGARDHATFFEGEA